MSFTVLVSFSLLALVVTSRPVLPVQNLTRDRPVALRNAIQAVFDNLSSDVSDPLFRDDHESHAHSTSAEEQNEYLIELDDTSIISVDSLSENEVPSTEDKKLYETLGNSQLDDFSGDVKATDSLVSGVSAEPEGKFLPSNESPAESDRASGNSTLVHFTLSPPLLVLTFSCTIALLGVLCVAVALYITRYLRTKIWASVELLELLPRLGKDNGELGWPGDSRGSDSLPNVGGSTTGLPRDTLAGGTATPLGSEKPEERVFDVEKLVDLPDLDANQSHEKLVDSRFEPAVDPFEDPVLPLQYPVLTCEYPIVPSEDKVLPMLFEDNPWELACKEEDESHDKEPEDGKEDRSEIFHDVEDVRPGILITTVDNVSSESHEDCSTIDTSPEQLYADPDLMPLPPSVPSSVSRSPVSAPPSPTPSPIRRLIQMRENAQSSPISRPAWSLRAADAPALGVPSNTSSKPNTPLPSPLSLSVALPSLPSSASSSSAPSSSAPSSSAPSSSAPSSPTSTSSPHTEPVDSSTVTTEVVPARRRAFRSQVPEFDIALAMQLRPGLGLGADPAWMVRFLMAMFGWFAVLLTGKRSTAVKTITAKKD